MSASKDKGSAIVLVAHGSPDPDWRRPLEQLHARLAEALPQPVALAYLAQDPALSTSVASLVEAGHGHLIVVAALLSPGGRHVKRDIPAAVEDARAAHPEVQIELVPGALGDDEAVITALAGATLSRLQPILRPTSPD